MITELTEVTRGLKLKFWPVELHLTHPWVIASSRGGGSPQVIMIELTDQDGVVGLGEAAPARVYDETPEKDMEFCRQVDTTRLSFDDIPGSMEYLASIAP